MPNYTNKKLSNYEAIKSVEDNEENKKYFCAKNLIDLIKSYEYQEVASHTYSHYYCLEPSKCEFAFKEDIKLSINLAALNDDFVESIIFPSNQLNDEYLEICRECGLKNYRGNETHWIYNQGKQGGDSIFKRGLRFLDSYINLFGHNLYELEGLNGNLTNVPASRFLRPYTSKLLFLESVKIKRIIADLKAAANQGLMYHLWWHPHNFGCDIEENLENLNKILKTYQNLNEEGKLRSMNMKEIGDCIREKQR